MAENMLMDSDSDDNNEVPCFSQLNIRRFNFSAGKFARLVGSRLQLRTTSDDEEENLIYRIKYRKTKKLAKGLIFENACLCDEVSQLQEKILIAKEERRFLLRKFLNYEAQKEKEHVNSTTTGVPNVVENSESITKKKTFARKRPPPKGDSVRSRSKKKKPPAEKRLVQAIPLESSGRPLFPIVLGALKVHSLGVIVHDRPTFHDQLNLYPIGFCSSRNYVSIKNPLQLCLYTCTIMDSAYGPRFEIAPEDSPEQLIVSNSLNDCHSLLLKAVNCICEKEVVSDEGHGAEFFGVSHPVIKNLLQSLCGARKCKDYKWIDFEVRKQKEEVNSDTFEDPSVSYSALARSLEISNC